MKWQRGISTIIRFKLLKLEECSIAWYFIGFQLVGAAMVYGTLVMSDVIVNRMDIGGSQGEN